MKLTIRQEQIEDYEITEQVVKWAFENAEQSDKREHHLVARLRKSDAFVPQLSLVAVKEDGQIVGHILLSEIKIINEEKAMTSLALAPVSVLPSEQNKGIGKLLIEQALKEAETLGYSSVVVLGHPGYYPKFGFTKASLWKIKAPFEVPDEAFMALALQEKALDQVSGVVEYPEVFFE